MHYNISIIRELNDFEQLYDCLRDIFTLELISDAGQFASHYSHVIIKGFI